MIAKARVLGLRAADARALRAAGNRILEYLEGGKEDNRRSEPAKAGAARLDGVDATGDGQPDPAAAVGRLARYYEAGPNGRARGRARGAGAPALGLVGPVTGEQLVRGLTGNHPITGQLLVSARGSSGRAAAAPKGSRAAPRHGPPDERLTIPEAAFIAGVAPAYLRLLAVRQPRTRFDAPTPSNELDPRVARRLLETLTGRPLNVPLPGADKDFLLADKDPATGEWTVRRDELERYLAERTVPETVMGYDIVCAAPKSVSLLWAVGDSRVRADIAEAFDAAVDAAVAYLEAHACFGMVDGRNQPGDGLAIVSYVHDTSRSSEAHLHTHNLVLNAVRVAVRHDDGRPVTDADGQPRVEWRALDSGSLLRHVKTAGYVGAAELRHQLASRWGVEWNTIRNGVAEIAGFPSALLHAFSTRHDQVTEEFAQLVEAGFDADGATEVDAQRRSRPPKTVLADDAVRSAQTDKLAGIGWTPDRMLNLIDVPPRSIPVVTDTDLADLHDLLVGQLGLTERQTTFTIRDVHQAVAEWAADRLTATQIRAAAEAFLADPRVVACASDRIRTRQDPDPVFTTESLLAAEDNLQTLYRQGRTDHGAIVIASLAGPAVTGAIATVNASLAIERDDPSARLSDEQADMVADVLASGDLIRCVLGPAGTGKTEAMRAAVTAWQTAGYVVVGSANGGAQTEQLGARLGVDAQVVRSWLTRLETADDPAHVWAPNTVLIVDEATQVATRDAEKLARWATRTGTVLVFIGDPAQLGSVGAGGWFRHIVYAHGAPSLSTVYRQAGAEMAEVRAALSGLRSEMPARVRKAMDRLAADRRIRVYDNPETLLAQAVDDWYADRHQRLTAGGSRTPKPSQMMAAHHREVDTLNGLARLRLIADSTITGSELIVGERRFAIGDEVVTLTQAGHTLVPAGASPDRYIRTGTIGAVTGVHIDGDHPDDQHVDVDFGTRGKVRVAWAYLNHEFADGRSGGLTHAYAITADRSQGSTMHAARAVGTDTTSRAAFYVMVSRGERDIAAYLVTDRDLAVGANDDQWLPLLRHPGGPFDAVVDHLERSRTERLATDLDPVAAAAHSLRRGHTLAELAAIRHATESNPEAGGGAGVTFVVARRAELAEHAAVGAQAIDRPRPELVARIGPRPTGGDHQRTWDNAVRAAAAYQARWEAEAGPPGYGRRAGWAIGPRPADRRSVWAEQRAQAELLVTRWATTLDPAQNQRFWAVIEHIPRDRATAGIHAMLAAGIHAEDIHTALTARERQTARAGSAVLEHRVDRVLSAHNLDGTGYQLPPPLTASAEWDHVSRLLVTAEANHLSSRQPVAALAAERHELAQLLTGAAPTTAAHRLATDAAAAQAAHDQVAARTASARHDHDAERAKRRPDRARLAKLRTSLETWEQRQADHAHNLSAVRDRLRAASGDADMQQPLRERHEVVTLALDLLVDHASTRGATHPPNYLTDLLGGRPADPEQAANWDRRARQVEAWRHHILGLPYGRPAADPTAPPSERALGPVPEDPTLAALRGRLIDHCQVTLDLGASV